MPVTSITFTQADLNNPAGTADGTYDYTADGNIPTSDLTLQYSIDGTNWIFLSVTNVDTNAGGGTNQFVAWTFTPLPEGTYSYRVQAVGLNPAGLPTGVPAYSQTAGPIFVPCFVMGTRIQTIAGEVPVENLCAGDRVVTVSGIAEAIVWVGHRHIDCRRHPQPKMVWPVRVRAGAFSDGVPSSDLWLSPDHAVFVDAVLIPIRQLINGATIDQIEVDEVTYYHIELLRHDVVMAEGLPCESYLDTGNRAAFANAEMLTILHPDFSGEDTDRIRKHGACAPFIIESNRIEPIWRRLAARTGLINQPASAHATNDPSLRICVAGQEIEPVLATENRYVFALPPRAGLIQIRSRAASPSDLRPWLDDRRQLGVAICRITLDGDVETIEVAIDNPSLTDGWHKVEREGQRLWRWTNGNAQLLVPPGFLSIEIQLAGATDYPSDTVSIPLTAYAV